ncbi:hypothetical protein [Kurthia senegalensis]|uniref:hypothetical protein n=1 Tax=Kurthia senegalensis TaxID=1033740 RepID=UPI000287AFFF|nr:hypothetical protein [Kurthia senegalensis]
MSIIVLLVFYLVSISLGMLAIYLGVPTQYAVGFFAVVAVVLVAGYSYVITSSKNTKLIMRLMRMQKSDPMFQYNMAVMNGTKEDQLDEIERVLRKNKKSKDTVADFLFKKALLENNLTEAKSIVGGMKKSPLKRYNQAQCEILMGKYGLAREIPQTEQWMKHSIEAFIAYEQWDQAKYIEEMDASIAKAKGLYRVQQLALKERALREWPSKKPSRKRFN